MKFEAEVPKWAYRIDAEIASNQVDNFDDIEMKCRLIIAEYEGSPFAIQVQRLALYCLLSRAWSQAASLNVTEGIFNELSAVGFDNPCDLAVSHTVMARMYAARGEDILVRQVISTGLRALGCWDSPAAKLESMELKTLVTELCGA